MPRSIGVVGVPSSAGAFAPGQDKAPHVLRAAGLIDQLRLAGLDVTDYGDTPGFRWRPDPEHRFAQNVDAVLDTVKAVHAQVDEVLKSGRIPLVIGGDCTIEIGTVLGHSDLGGRIGLLYFDAHPDLNRPIAPGPGALDWTGIAHLLGEPETIAQLSGVGDRLPILEADQVYLYGRDPEQQTVLETEAIARLGIRSTAVAEIETDPEGSARMALANFATGIDRLLVHFDVDIIDFTDLPISHNAERNKGLSFDATMRALTVILSHEKLSSLTITELNPDFADGEVIRTFIDRLVTAMVGSRF